MKQTKILKNKNIIYRLDSRLLSNPGYNLKATTTNLIMLTWPATHTEKFKIYERVNWGLTHRLEYYVGPERKNLPERCKLVPDDTGILNSKLNLILKPVLFRARCLEFDLKNKLPKNKKERYQNNPIHAIRHVSPFVYHKQNTVIAEIETKVWMGDILASEHKYKLQQRERFDSSPIITSNNSLNYPYLHKREAIKKMILCCLGYSNNIDVMNIYSLLGVW